jgi:hypothetical protein
MTSANPHLSYFNYVCSLCADFPRLQLLADFMSDQISISRFQLREDVERRMTMVDVTTVDLGARSPIIKNHTNLSASKTHLDW